MTRTLVPPQDRPPIIKLCKGVQSDCSTSLQYKIAGKVPAWDSLEATIPTEIMVVPKAVHISGKNIKRV